MIKIDVKYNLLEHVKLIDESLRAEVLKFSSCLKWYHKVAIKLFSYIVIPPLFFFKISKVGSCIFLIDEEAVQRNSKAGQHRVEWSNIESIQVFSHAYTINMKKGSLPIPFRCFDSEERKLFEEYASSKLVTVRTQTVVV